MTYPNVMIQDALRYIQMPTSKRDKQAAQSEQIIENEKIIEKIKDTYDELDQISLSKYVYNSLPIYLDEDTISFEYTKIKIVSQDLSKLFKNCSRCYILAATLGQNVDRQIGIAQKQDMLNALILDACASVLIDKVCDDIEQKIIEELQEGEFLTMRFSPGYGDVPLGVQPQVTDVLNTSKRIGLSLTKTNMLIPTKSVTAFIGVSNQKENRMKNCAACNLVRVCAYKERGDRCGL